MNVKVKFSGKIHKISRQDTASAVRAFPNGTHLRRYGMFSLKIEVAEVPGKNIHILSDFVGGNSRVDLCGLDICVAEHL